MICLVVACLFAWPVSWGPLTGLFLWTSPLLFLTTILSRHFVSLWALFGAVTLVFISSRHRWYCRWLCPTGCLCDAVSHLGRRTRISRLPRIGPAMAVAVLLAAVMGMPGAGLLDPIVLLHAFWDGCRPQAMGLASLKMGGLMAVVAINAFAPQIWCSRLCPLGGLQDIVIRLRQRLWHGSQSRPSFQPSRRMTLGACAGAGLGLWVKNTSQATSHLIRPPGALPGDTFSATCIRCGNCGKACPTQIIKTSFDLSDWAGLMTPHVSFASGYCVPDCTACGSVCPTGAIKPFSREEKTTLFMGVAHIQAAQCLLAQQKECDRCQFYCDYDAVTIHSSDIDFSAWPEVHKDRCVGCGACVAACPVSAITIEPRS